MAYVVIAVIVLVVIAVSAVILWGIIKLFNADMTFRAVLATVLVAELLSLIPVAGLIISIVVYYYLLYNLSSINSVLMCVVITVVARLCSLALFTILGNIFS